MVAEHRLLFLVGSVNAASHAQPRLGQRWAQRHSQTQFVLTMLLEQVVALVLVPSVMAVLGSSLASKVVKVLQHSHQSQFVLTL